MKRGAGPSQLISQEEPLVQRDLKRRTAFGKESPRARALIHSHSSFPSQVCDENKFLIFTSLVEEQVLRGKISFLSSPLSLAHHLETRSEGESRGGSGVAKAQIRVSLTTPLQHSSWTAKPGPGSLREEG
jgi:hypothetical protein